MTNENCRVQYRTSPLAVIAMLAMAVCLVAVVAAPNLMGWTATADTERQQEFEKVFEKICADIDELQDVSRKHESALENIEDELLAIKRRLKIGQVGDPG